MHVHHLLVPEMKEICLPEKNRIVWYNTETDK